MILKKAKYKTIMVKHKHKIHDDIRGCDECKTEIKNYSTREARIDIKVFNKDDMDDVRVLDFCSWDCLLKHVPKITSDNFATLPVLYFGVEKTDKCSAYRLMELLTNKIN